jgi:hypothetical protein
MGDVLFDVKLIAGLSEGGRALTLQQFRIEAGGFVARPRTKKTETRSTRSQRALSSLWRLRVCRALGVNIRNLSSDQFYDQKGMKLVLVMKKYTHLFLLFLVLLFNIATANAQNIQYIQSGNHRAATPEVSRTGFWPLQSLSRAATTLALMTAEIAVPMGPLYTPEPPATIEAPPTPIKVMNQVFEVSVSATPIAPARTSVSKQLKGQTTGDMKIDEILVEAGTEHGVEPLLLYSVMHQESAFNTQATSHKGARGLMQLMPATAARFGVKNIYDPEQNIHGAAQYLRFLLDMFDGDVRLALAGYNAGEGAVKKYGYSVPPYPETMNYVKKITRRYTTLTTVSE